MKRILLSAIVFILSHNCAYSLDHPANYKIKSHLNSDTTLLLFENLKVNELDSLLRFEWAFSPQVQELIQDRRIVVKYAITDSLTPVSRLSLGYPWILAEFSAADNAGLLSNLKPSTSYSWNIGVLESQLSLRIVDSSKILWQFTNGEEPSHHFKKNSSWLIFGFLAILILIVLGVAMKKGKINMNS